MKILEPLFKNVISELIENNVLFILIGGYAVNYYGYGRYTGDIATKTILKKLKNLISQKHKLFRLEILHFELIF